MHRQPLLQLLDAYEADHPSEQATITRVRQLVHAHPDCFERTCLPGHITGSAWIVSAEGTHVLLTHHRKLDRWLQLGGHADGQSDILAVAIREAQEESGMQEFTTVGASPLDIDVHLIPARGNEPAHWHHDIRFLLIAGSGQELCISDESHDLQWIDRARLGEFTQEESLLRLERKTRQRLV